MEPTRNNYYYIDDEGIILLKENKKILFNSYKIINLNNSISWYNIACNIVNKIINYIKIFLNIK
jgi:hypothetical protein